jgi:hypothetical protein
LKKSFFCGEKFRRVVLKNFIEAVARRPASIHRPLFAMSWAQQRASKPPGRAPARSIGPFLCRIGIRQAFSAKVGRNVSHH